ncbi:class I adenylate-forming enzyme family protein [Sphingomonas immobilis]|uniref:Fatty acid--CoA ligase family protein n=1 Tax=Sphingomonas immobilis TaxID=3063997 RepID=A0ABT8ZWW8_9SPHN|nr:fatty acid--CoA ligase family protein [Sphingomonas sp. CA1-15]MDO7842065.1 fatty acid--CoA ligase family protein [Sphingomonas sp. CA1-15]
MASIGQQLDAVMAIDPAAPTFIGPDERWRTWGDFAAAIAATRAILDDVAPEPGARVGILLRNRAAQVTAMLSVIGSGRCMVVLNPALPAARLLEDVGTLELAAIIGEGGDLDLAGFRDRAGGAGTALIELTGDLAAPRLATPGARGRARVAQEGVALEMLTSGTTGPPKRIPLTRIAFEMALSGATVYERGRAPGDAPKLRDTVAVLTNPIAHIGGLFAILSTLLAGRRVCMLERFSVEAWRKAIVQYRPKVASVVPAALRMVLDADIPPEDLASLTALRCGTAPLDPQIAREFLQRYDLPVLQNYGATEFVGGVAGWTLPDFRAHFEQKSDSSGRLHADVGARIVDPDSGDVLPDGAEGLLELKTAMIGGVDRWHRTTDRAVIDADRFLFIRGRADNAIIRGGFKVHPDDVVKALEAHPAVREASVVGLPDPRLGQVPAAAIIPRNGTVVSAEELQAFVRDTLSAYQIPVRFLFVDTLPRTPSMKPALPEVAKLFAHEATPA